MLKKSQISSLYNKISGFYDLYALIGFPIRKRIYRNILPSLNIKQGSDVLDICCGTGLNFSYFQKIIGPSGRITGVDLTKGMLNQAQKRAIAHKWNNVDLIQGDISQIDKIATKKVDVIVCSLAFCLIPGKEEVLRKLKNLLKPGGTLIIIDVKLFGGFLKILNPFLVFFLRAAAVTFDTLKEKPWLYARKVFKNNRIEQYLLGCCYVFIGN